MKRHRVRTGGPQDRAMWVARTMLLAGVGVCGALFYVYQHTQIVQAGYNLRQSEKVLEECVKKNISLEMKIAKLKSPEYLERLVVKYDLQLVKPQADQIVRVRGDKTKSQLSSSQKGPMGTVN